MGTPNPGPPHFPLRALAHALPLATGDEEIHLAFPKQPPAPDSITLRGWVSSLGGTLASAPEEGTWRVSLPAGALRAAARASDPLAGSALWAWDQAHSPAPPPRLMGILNLTPDSFSDGGEFLDPGRAIERGRAMVGQGADILDVGGESTRPGADPVAIDEELERVLPVIEVLASVARVPISVDTRHASVAAAALERGATMVNDVSAGTHDPEMLPTVAAARADYVAMHMRGDPRTMQDAPRYGDPVDEVFRFLHSRLQACLQAGIDISRITLDPGIGFGKDLDHNLEILRRLPELRSLGLPLLLGVSRKSFINDACRQSRGAPDHPPALRTGGTAAAVTACVFGGAHILRVHDVAAMKEACAVAYALRESGPHPISP